MGIYLLRIRFQIQTYRHSKCFSYFIRALSLSNQLQVPTDAELSFNLSQLLIGSAQSPTSVFRCTSESVPSGIIFRYADSTSVPFFEFFTRPNALSRTSSGIREYVWMRVEIPSGSRPRPRQDLFAAQGRHFLKQNWFRSCKLKYMVARPEAKAI